MTSGKCLTLAGFLGLTGVTLGAFGAHAVHATLLARQTAPIWQTAVSYQLIHSAALVALAGWGAGAAKRAPRLVAAATWCWVTGVVLFSGSLYWLALGAPAAVGPVTPLGGLLLLAGWALLIAAGCRAPAHPPAG